MCYGLIAFLRDFGVVEVRAQAAAQITSKIPACWSWQQQADKLLPWSLR